MGRPKKKQRRQIATDGPTPEQAARFNYAETVSPEGKRFIRVPAIDTLHKRGILTAEDHKALHRFRDLWIACERSEVRSCLDDRPKGGGGSPAPSSLRAQSDLRGLECALGALAPITRAVAGEDVSLAQWAIAQSGCKGSGNPVCLPKTWAMDNAKMDIRFAASRLRAHLAA